jgi:hypothetical protein
MRETPSHYRYPCPIEEELILQKSKYDPTNEDVFHGFGNNEAIK